MAKFDPLLSLDCNRVEGVGAQCKERKGSNFAAWRSGARVQGINSIALPKSLPKILPKILPNFWPKFILKKFTNLKLRHVSKVGKIFGSDFDNAIELIP